MFPSQLKLTVEDETIIIEQIRDSEKEQYLLDKKEHGKDVAYTNLMITLCKRIINAKKFRITYFSEDKK